MSFKKIKYKQSINIHLQMHLRSYSFGAEIQFALAKE